MRWWPPATVPLGRAVAEGLRWLAGHRFLRTLALLLAVNLFCFQLAAVTLVLLATSELRMGVTAYGLLLAASAVGGIAGGLASHRGGLLLALGGAVPAYLAAGFSTGPYTLGLCLAAIGFFSSMWSVATVSLRQSVVPPELLGRVSAVYRMLSLGLAPLGAVAGGFVVHEWGVRAAYPIAGVLRGAALVAALPVILSCGRACRRGRGPG
ncbi:hypothetical protein ACQP2X_25575 [Actinoplanes sp. CA-131856]